MTRGGKTMGTRSILLHFPAYPFTLETLRPQHDMASMAAILCRAGHDTRIWDYGTVENLDRLFAPELRSNLVVLAEGMCSKSLTEIHLSLGLHWKLWRMSRHVRAQQDRLAEDAARQICAEKNTAFVLFKLDSPNDLRSALPIVRQLRRGLPETVLVATGPAIASSALTAGRAATIFDCLYLGPPDPILAELADSVADPTQWPSIPNLAYELDGRLAVTEARAPATLGSLPTPLYDPAIYPALDNCSKLRLFDIEVWRRSNHENSDQSGEAVPFSRPAGAICEEAEQLYFQFGTRAFHFRGCSPFTAHTSALASELLARRLNIRYSRDGHAASVTPATIVALKASGCRALSFQIDSGSQRLLDDVYENPFGVTQVEQVLRASKFADIFTVARFTYPCIEDDYHTKAETLRLVTRTRPHAAPIALPPGDLVQHAENPAHLSMVDRRIRREHLALRQEIEEQGISTGLTAQTALMANLAGYAEREQEFLEEVRHCLLTGDTPGIADLVARVNGGACTPASATIVSSFVSYQNAMGN